MSQKCHYVESLRTPPSLNRPSRHHDGLIKTLGKTDWTDITDGADRPQSSKISADDESTIEPSAARPFLPKGLSV